MKKILLVVSVVLLALFSLILYRNWRVQNSPYQEFFLTGTFPYPLPDGFHNGSIQALETPWKGKIFEASSSSGINVFEGDKKNYSFKIYKGKGLKDKNLDVLKIDYNLAENPFWVRFILDELVQNAPGKYTGKVHLLINPNFSLSLGFFRLERR